MSLWCALFGHKGKSNPNGLVIQELTCKRCDKIFYLDRKGYFEDYFGHQYTQRDYLGEKAVLLSKKGLV